MWTGAGLGAGKMVGKNLSESGALEAAFRGSPWAGVAGGGAGGTAHLVVWFPSSGEQKRLPSCGEQDEAQEGFSPRAQCSPALRALLPGQVARRTQPGRAAFAFLHNERPHKAGAVLYRQGGAVAFSLLLEYRLEPSFSLCLTLGYPCLNT